MGEGKRLLSFLITRAEAVEGEGEEGHLIAIARRSSEKESSRIERFSFYLGSCVEWRPPLMLWL